MESVHDMCCIKTFSRNILISRDGIDYTAGMLYQCASEISEFINNERKIIAVCCSDYINRTAAAIAIGKLGKRALLLDSRNSDAFNLKIMNVLNCSDVIYDGVHSFEEHINSVRIYINETAVLVSDEITLNIPEYVFPYISVDGKIISAHYNSSEPIEFGKFFKDKLGFDFSSVYAEFDENSIFSAFLWTMVASNDGRIYMGRTEENKLCIVPISKAYDIAANATSDISYLTYGQGNREIEVRFSEIAEERDLKWYNVFGYPYCSYITKIRKSAGRYFHIGKPFNKVRTIIMNPDKVPLQFSLVGNIYDTKFNENAETADLNGNTLYKTSYIGNFTGERNVLFKDVIKPFENVCGDYINTDYLSDVMKKISGVKECITKQINDSLYAVCMTNEEICFEKAYSFILSELPHEYTKTRFMFEFGDKINDDSFKLADNVLILEIIEKLKKEMEIVSSVTITGNNEIFLRLPSDTDVAEAKRILNNYLDSCGTVEINIALCSENGNKSESINKFSVKKELSEQEKAILEIWREVLNKPDLNENDNIYYSGGNSLDLMKIIYRISKYIGKDIMISMFESMETPRESFDILKIIKNDDYYDDLYNQSMNDDIDDIISSDKYNSEEKSENTIILARNTETAYFFAEKLILHGIEKVICIVDSINKEFDPDNKKIKVIDLSENSDTMLGESEEYRELGKNSGRVICFVGAYEKAANHAKSYSMDVIRIKEAIKFSLYENKKSLFIIDDIETSDKTTQKENSLYNKSRHIICSLCDKAFQAGIEGRIIKTGIIGGDKRGGSDIIKLCAECGCLPSEIDLKADISDPDELIDDILSSRETTSVYSANIADLHEVFEELNIEYEAMPYELWYIMADQLAVEKNYKLPEIWKEISVFKDTEKYIGLYNGITDKELNCKNALRKLVLSAVENNI